MSKDEQIIRDASDLRKYRIELPNLYDDLGLDVYEFRLLAHYKRVGRCTESTATTAKVCNMSAGKVSETRLALKDKQLIKMLKMPIPGGYSYVIEVSDVWMRNFKKYAKNAGFQTPSPHEDPPSHSESTPSHSETKKELKNLSSSSSTDRSKNAVLYEQEIGQLTAMIADELADAEKTYPPDWIPEAIQIAVVSNKRSWKYVLGILKNCKEKNIRPSLSKFEKGKNNGNPAGSAKSPAKSVEQSEPSPEDLAAAERIKAKRRQSVP